MQLRNSKRREHVARRTKELEDELHASREKLTQELGMQQRKIDKKKRVEEKMEKARSITEENILHITQRAEESKNWHEDIAKMEGEYSLLFTGEEEDGDIDGGKKP